VCKKRASDAVSNVKTTKLVLLLVARCKVSNV
jgi:hypothetical protein